tara:strand:+ start:24617 stop:26284 length:1668 start_codon:yes stop_codon:yes gene_type:complete
MGYLKTHQPCDDCGSSDALAVNDDGSSFCFSCERHRKSTDELLLDDEEDEEETMKHNPRHASHLNEGEFMDLPERGITKETCEAYNVTIAPNGYKHYYPYYNEDNELIAQKHRIYTSDNQKTFQTMGDWDQTTLFGQSICRKGGKYITLCEGELDALAAYQMQGSKWPVVSIKNGAGNAVKDVQRAFEFLTSYDNIVVCFDNDKAGKKAAKKVAELLSPKAKVMHLNLKDANEYLIQDKIEEFTKLWWASERYTPDGIIAGTELWGVLKEGPTKTAIDYPYGGLNFLTNGIRMGELITVCAGTGIGKSSFLREIIHHIFKYTDDNIGMMFMEESVRSTAEAMMSLEVGKPLHLPTVTGEPVCSEDRYLQAYQDTVGSGRYFFFDHFGSNSIDNILARIRYFARAVKCKYIVLDHISIIVSSQEHSFDERRTIDECMTKLRTAVQELDICLITVSHLRRLQHGSHEEGYAVSLSDLRGSASIAQLSDMVIGLERNSQSDDEEERDTTYVRVIKNRFTGRTGLCTKLFYNFADGRMVEKELDPANKDEDDDDDENSL